ncbi:MAG TPA: polysaccharide deacetylase family protein [Anaerolineales bacterium]|nr:polysaccharide deacetylase family protein [Anaerolineales bacterium]
MSPSPRVLLSIDYEPWFALFRRYEKLTDPVERCLLDDKFTLNALDPILEQLGNAKASIYLVGEIAQWYPEIPRKIVSAGHELGLHCQIHRPLINIDELSADIQASAAWCKEYHVRGYRAPRVGINESAYSILSDAGFIYSSSIYAPAGTLLKKHKVWELPVSTLRFFGKNAVYAAPRDFSVKLLASGEFPYGSSFSIGLSAKLVLKIIENELKQGLSPVIFLHPYELIRPSNWLSRVWRDVLLNPLLSAFTINKSIFLADLLRNFPVSSLGEYLDEVLDDHADDPFLVTDRV